MYIVLLTHIPYLTPIAKKLIFQMYELIIHNYISLIIKTRDLSLFHTHTHTNDSLSIISLLYTTYKCFVIINK